jgi:hypothetical protein
VEILPPDGYIFKIKWFKLTTPLEVQGNILVTGQDGEETRLLNREDTTTGNQPENLTDELYDSSDWDAEALFLQKFRLYGIVTGYDPTTGTTSLVTTADRQLVLKFSGSIVKYK